MDYTYFQSFLCLTYGIVMLMSSFEAHVKRKYIEVALFFICIFIVFYLPFRPVNETPDTVMYSQVFMDVPDIWNLLNGNIGNIGNIPMEWGYILLNSVVHFFIESPIIVFFAMAVISIFSYYFLFCRISPYPALSFFLYMTFIYIFRETAQIRNGVACALVLYSVKFLYEGAIKKYIFLVLIAMTFHLTAIVGFLFYFINKIKWTRQKVALILASSVVIMNIQWIYGVMQTLGDMGLLYYRIAKYQGDLVAEQDITVVKVLIYCLMLFLFGIIHKNVSNNKLYNLLLGILCIGVLIQSSFHEFRELADRLSSVLYTSVFLLIPLFLKDNKYRIYLLIVILLSFPFYFYHTLMWIKDPLQ